MVVIGQVFGKWTVLEEAARHRTPGGSLKRYWACACACGTRRAVVADSLVSGKSVDCGCGRLERVAQKLRTHGQRHHPLYDVWTAMLQRCENPGNKRYADYGGRGIKVCAHWHDFAAFLADVGMRPPGKSIDRFPNNDGDYEPGNFRWATQKEQVANSRPRRTGKLTAEKAVLIFKSHESTSKLAREFAVTASMIVQIRLGYTWASATGATPRR